MKTLNLTFALIAFFTVSFCHAQSTNAYADSALDLQVSVVYNSNMSYQVPTTQDLLFLADTLNNSSIIGVGNVNVNSTYAFDPATEVFPFVLDTNGSPARSAYVLTGLNQVYFLGLGFNTSMPATISVTAAFNSLPNGTYYAFLKRLSTGETFPILNDTVSLTIPANTNFSTDFILIVGPSVVTAGINQTCHGDGTGGVSVNCATSNWNYKIYNSSNNLIRQHGVQSIDTTITYLQQGNYTVVTLLDHLVIDSTSFVINAPAPIVPLFTVSNYLPSQNEVVSFVNESSGASSYSWNFGDSITDTLASTSHAYSTAGTYIITLTAFNGSCSETATDSLNVLPAPIIAPNNNYTQTNNHHSDPNASSTQREESNPQVNVATDMHKITVSSENELSEMTIEILNMNGQLIYSGRSNSGTVETTVEKTGVYSLHITFENGSVVTKNIMVL